MIYAEQVGGKGTIKAKGIYMTYLEACYADKEARKTGDHLAGDLLTNIALNRFRRNCCIYCGAPVGQHHYHCVVGAPSPQPFGGFLPGDEGCVQSTLLNVSGEEQS